MTGGFIFLQKLHTGQTIRFCCRDNPLWRSWIINNFSICSNQFPAKEEENWKILNLQWENQYGKSNKFLILLTLYSDMIFKCVLFYQRIFIVVPLKSAHEELTYLSLLLSALRIGVSKICVFIQLYAWNHIVCHRYA